VLIKRIITALIAIPLLIALITWGGQQLFLIIIMLTAGCALLEFYNMTLRISVFRKMLGLAFGLCLVWCMQHYHQYLSLDGTHYESSLLYLLITLPTLVTFSILLLQFSVYPRKLMGNAELPIMLIGILYICLFLSYLILLHNATAGKRWIVFLLLVLWCGDSGAYVTGRLLGKHPLSPLVSPKKTIEGALGCIVLSLCAAGATQMLFFNDLAISHALLLGLGIALAGQLGDLCESTIKRHSGIKDSGTLLPGHGGMLDRIDSLLFVAPLAYYYKVLIV